MAPVARLTPTSLQPVSPALALISDVAAHLAAGGPIDDALHKVLELLRRALNASDVAVWTFAPAGLTRTWGVGHGGTTDTEIVALLEAGDLANDRIVLARMIAGERHLGVLVLRVDRSLDSEERIVLATIADLLAPALELPREELLKKFQRKITNEAGLTVPCRYIVLKKEVPELLARKLGETLGAAKLRVTATAGNLVVKEEIDVPFLPEERAERGRERRLFGERGTAGDAEHTAFDTGEVPATHEVVGAVVRRQAGAELVAGDEALWAIAKDYDSGAPHPACPPRAVPRRDPLRVQHPQPPEPARLPEAGMGTGRPEGPEPLEDPSVVEAKEPSLGSSYGLEVEVEHLVGGEDPVLVEVETRADVSFRRCSCRLEG